MDPKLYGILTGISIAWAPQPYLKFYAGSYEGEFGRPGSLQNSVDNTSSFLLLPRLAQHCPATLSPPQRDLTHPRLVLSQRALI